MSDLTNLTESDIDCLKVAMTCFIETPKLDHVKFARLLGIKPRSARDKWWLLRKKLFSGNSANTADGEAATACDGPSDVSPKTPTPKTPKSNKRKKNATNVDNDGTPVKRTKKNSKAMPGVQNEAEAEAEVEDENAA